MHSSSDHVQQRDDSYDWEATEDSDEDDGMKPALAIDDGEDDEGDEIQLDQDTEDGPPMTAEQYLRQVRREARRMPHVVVAHTINPRAYDHQQTVSMPTIQTLPTCPSSVLPSISWLDSYGQRFADERQALIRYAAIQRKKHQKQLMAAAESGTPLSTPPTPSFPLVTDTSAWLQYCLHTAQPTLHIMTHMDQITTRGILYILFGYIHRYVKSQGKRRRSDASESHEMKQKLEQDEKIEDPSQHITSYESTQTDTQLASIITSIETPSSSSTLDTTSSTPPSDFLARPLSLWLYVLLLRLDKPIHAEMASLLCQGYRDIATLRASQCSPSSPIVIHANLLLGIIDKCFGQRVV